MQPEAPDPGRAAGLFSSDEVGRDVVLEPATLEDMCGKANLDKPSLEVIYDDV
jgi:chlorophyllide a reductase subunit X